MGSPLAEATWNGAEGAIYMGVGSQWPLIWLIVSIGLCVLALIVGGGHESQAYRRERDRVAGLTTGQRL